MYVYTLQTQILEKNGYGIGWNRTVTGGSNISFDCYTAYPD